jgi:predicted short-subunit dehydrogenase-like oxidoreductase (DUF2520 family)
MVQDKINLDLSCQSLHVRENARITYPCRKPYATRRTCPSN